MKSFIKIKESFEEFLATMLVILSPIVCISLFLTWLPHLVGCNHVNETVVYITYDIIVPVFVITALLAIVIWTPQVIWGISSYLFKRIKKAWKN